MAFGSNEHDFSPAENKHLFCDVMLFNERLTKFVFISARNHRSLNGHWFRMQLLIGRLADITLVKLKRIDTHYCQFNGFSYDQCCKFLIFAIIFVTRS